MKTENARYSVIISALTASLLAMGLLSGCSSKPADASTPSVAPTPGQGTGTAVVPASTFQITSDFSQSTFSGNNPKVATYLHRTQTNSSVDTDWSNDCSVQMSETDTNKKYIGCMLEVNELDLWFNSFNINWGAATGMCSYVGVYPYWFFKKKADIHGTANGVSVSVTTTDGGPPSFDAVAGGNAGGIAELHGSPPAVHCKYDYTWMSPVAGPNCCEGTYTQTTTACTSNTPPAAATCTATVSVQNWGGAYGNCAAGPAADTNNWKFRDVIHNFPLGQIYEAIDGIGQIVKVSPPVSLGPLHSDVWSASYVKNAVPAALTDVDFVHTGGESIGHKYVFICYDQNEESIARIDLDVRKWNTYAELQKKQAGNPAVTGPETTFPGDFLDYLGWDDFVSLLTLQYPGDSL